METYICVEYETIRERKTWKCLVNDEDPRNEMFALGNVVLEEKGKFIKVLKVWFENK